MSVNPSRELAAGMTERDLSNNSRKGKATHETEMTDADVAAHAAMLDHAEATRTRRFLEIEEIYDGARERAVIEQKAMIELGLALETVGKHALQTARDVRMSLNSEMGEIMRSLRDIREFLGDVQHVGDVGRLREFVDVAQRLKALRDSGFLDDVVDTLLRVGERR